MTFINATLWNDIQESNAYDEKRYAPLGLIDSIKESTPQMDFILPSSIEKMNTLSSLRNLDIPVIKEGTVTVTQVPGFNIPSNLEESTNQNYVAFDVFSGFRHYPGAYENNMLDSEVERDRKMLKTAYAMAQTIETISQSVIELQKTQLLGFTDQVSYNGDYTFNAGTDTLEIDKTAQNENIFFDLEALMSANELNGQYNIVTSRAGLVQQKSALLKYGAANDKNLQALGAFPMDQIFETNTISAGSDNFNGYMFRKGSLGFVENFPFDFRNGTEIGNMKWDVTDVELPFTRMRANVFTNRFASNSTALITSGTDSNLIMGSGEEMGIWTRFYLCYEPNTALATRANPIVKLKGLTTSV